MAEADFYTYIHRRASTGEVFYVGKGKGQRAHSRKCRSELWRRIVAKHGLVVEVVAFFFKEADAFDHERMLISEHRAAGAVLANMTDGGDGASGAKRSDETKRRMSEARKGKGLGPLSPEHRAKMSASARGRPMSAEAIAKTAAAHRGMKRRPETLAKMSAALKGKPGRPLTPEAKARLIASRLGTKHSEETRAKMSKKRVKKHPPLTEEHRAKISAARKQYWIDWRAAKAGSQ